MNLTWYNFKGEVETLLRNFFWAYYYNNKYNNKWSINEYNLLLIFIVEKGTQCYMSHVMVRKLMKK